MGNTKKANSSPTEKAKSKDIKAGRLEVKKAEKTKEISSKKAKSTSLESVQKKKKSPAAKVKKAKLTSLKSVKNDKQIVDSDQVEAPFIVQEKVKKNPAKKAKKNGNPLSGVTYAAFKPRAEIEAHNEIESGKAKKCQKSKKEVSKPAEDNTTKNKKSKTK